MLVRSKQSDSVVRWPRRGRDGHQAVRQSAPANGDAASGDRRHGGPTQDRALYTCECGYAFHAPVTTSVGCPHCARTQAW